MRDIYAALDIGSATLKLVVAEIVGTSLHVLYAKKIPSHGIKVGVVEDESTLSRDVRTLILDAQNELDTKITSVAVNIPSLRANLYQSNGSTTLAKEGAKITHEDVIRCLRLSSNFKRSKREEVISVIPVQYQSDKGVTSKAPINEITRNLIVDTQVITTDKKLLYPYLSAIEKADVEILEIGVNAYSSAKEAFDEVYLQEGAILIDIGYKLTTISYFKDGYLQYLTTCHVGGYDFTKRIAQEFQITMNQAEAYKIKYGSLDTTVGQDDIIHTTYLLDNRKDYMQKDLANILSDIAKEVMEVIKERISVIEKVEEKEILLVGGGSELALLDVVASEVLQSPVRMYRPETIGVRDMSYVSSLGLLYYLLERSKIGGKYPASLMLEDVSSTMTLRFKGLTKAPKVTSEKVEKKSNKFGKILDAFLSEE